MVHRKRREGRSATLSGENHMSDMATAWVVVTVVVPLLIGVGYNVLGYTPPEFTVARVCFSIAALILAAVTVIWALTTDWPTSPRVVVGGLLALLTIIGYPELMRWVGQKESRTQGKMVEAARSRLFARVNTMIVSNYPGWLFYRTDGLQPVLQPIGLVVSWSVTNTSSVPLRVTNYLFDVQVAGKWNRALNVASLNPKGVFAVLNGDLEHAKQNDFSSNWFDANARTTPIALGETISGWSFFAWPRGLRGPKTPEIQQLSITIDNTLGERQLIAIKPPKGEVGQSAISGGAIVVTGQQADLRGILIQPPSR